MMPFCGDKDERMKMKWSVASVVACLCMAISFKNDEKAWYVRLEWHGPLDGWISLKSQGRAATSTS